MIPGAEDTATLASRARPVVAGLGGAFMISPEAKAAGKDGGFRGRELYVVGRGAALGDPTAVAVAAAFGFWEPGVITTAWEASRAKAPVQETLVRYTEVCRDWGRHRWTGLQDVDRLAELLGSVADAADASGWPLSAGWRAQPVPSDAPGRAAQLLHVLREHRGGAHLTAVRVAGLGPSRPSSPARVGRGTPPSSGGQGRSRTPRRGCATAMPGPRR